LGIKISLIEVQPEKHLYPSETTEFGISISHNEEHFSKQHSAIEITE
jgi:hypothetical protein